MSNKWTQADIPNLTGKITVVTGANSGLGFECSQTFAEKGATVVMTARNLEKGKKAKTEILKAYPNASLDLMKLDVGDLASVREFAEAFKAKYDRLDILLNNAGVMAIPRQETPDGFEMQLGVNHLGHFALTGLLLEVIVKTPKARIHNVTSSANWTGAINFDDLMGEKEYSRWGAYGQSKLANVFFTYELQKRLTAAGYDTITNTSHPGLVIGNLQANSVEQSGTRMEAWLYSLSKLFMAQDIKMGVLPMLYGMTAEDAKGGVFYTPRTLNMRGYPKEGNANAAANDAESLKRFWEVSEELTGMKYL
jgi:NAD(P)-dependent dehydrogenase (short-subunit alcohol dehydrogenase family)